jgi:hypothetical protein
MTLFDDRISPEARPFYRDNNTLQILWRIGEYTLPEDCEHPISARVGPPVRIYKARCRDCGYCQNTWTGRWEMWLP